MLINMVLNSLIHVQEESLVAVIFPFLNFDPFTSSSSVSRLTDDVINNAESLTSDDEDDETDDEDTSEGSADNLLIF